MILVTGGAGYIGSVMAELLLGRGYEVAALDNLSRGHRDAVPPGAVFVEAELSDHEALARLFRRYPIEAVMHFAAYALVGESMEKPEAYFRNNTADALALIEQTLRAGVKRFVFSSTCAVFGDRAQPPIAEDAPKDPINPYGESKLMAERILEWCRRAHALEPFLLRYFNACGATAERGERHDPETHLIPLVLNAAAGESESVRILGGDYPTPDGTCIRDYIHVEDLAEAHLAALEADSALAGGYNLGAGKGHSVKEVIETARRVSGHPIPAVLAPRRPGDPPELVADPRKAQQRLGWRAQRDLECAIRSAWEFKMRQSQGAEKPR